MKLLFIGDRHKKSKPAALKSGRFFSPFTTSPSFSTGTVVSGSTARYRPFGGYHTMPSQTITDRGFTGHLHNDSVGLIYMNARFYLPGVGRFASADTIVPEPANPQAWNRYSYVENNPILYNDPTGHCKKHGECLVDGDNQQGVDPDKCRSAGTCAQEIRKNLKNRVDAKIYHRVDGYLQGVSELEQAEKAYNDEMKWYADYRANMARDINTANTRMDCGVIHCPFGDIRTGVAQASRDLSDYVHNGGKLIVSPVPIFDVGEWFYGSMPSNDPYWHSMMGDVVYIAVSTVEWPLYLTLKGVVWPLGPSSELASQVGEFSSYVRYNNAIANRDTAASALVAMSEYYVQEYR